MSLGSSPRRPARAALAIAVGLLLVSCQASSSGSPGATATSAGGSPSAAASPGTADCVAPPTVCGGPLPAGDYVSDSTGAHITFSLDEHDWSGSRDTPGDGFGLFLADIPDGGIAVAHFPGEVYTDPCGISPGDPVPVDPTPAAFIGYLAEHIGYTGLGPVEVEVGGRPGVQLDLAADFQALCPGSTSSKYWVFPGAVHDLWLEDGERDRVVAIDSGSGLVTIWIYMTSPDGDFAHLLEHGRELLDSMTITPLE